MPLIFDPRSNHLDTARALLADLPRRRSSLLACLHRLQDALGELHPDHVALVAEVCGVSLAEAYETASFYDHFTLGRPAPRIRRCTGPACAMHGLPPDARGSAEVTAGETGCIGACDRAPAALVDGMRQAPDRPPSPSDTNDGPSPAPLDAAPPMPADTDLVALLAALERASLGGMSGGGFSVAAKWRLVAAAPAPRYLIVNADEGEPGSFKDRRLLEQAPAQVLSAALVAARAIDAAVVHIYLRNEYKDLLPRLTKTGADLAAAGHRTRLEWHRGAGSYVCGEETALIESLEGRPGRPRHKPPYPAQVGLYGRPTLVQNVETLYWVGEIAARGAGWYASHGRRGRHGLRLVSISGRVRRPGVYAIPLGSTVAEIIDDLAGGMADGHHLAAFLPNGASGGVLPASARDSVFDAVGLEPHGATAGCGALIVLSEADDVRSNVQRLMAFLAHESCGQCTPCRSGTAAAARQLGEKSGEAGRLLDLATAMAFGSICGLGHGAGRLLDTYMRHFASDPEA